MSEQDSDYDGAWKEGLRHHSAEFLAKYIVASIFEVAYSGVGQCLADLESHLHC
jgi:hypothetical protein